MMNKEKDLKGTSKKTFYKIILIQSVSILVFVGLSIFTTHRQKLNTAKQATEIISNFIVNEENREVIQALSAMTKTNFIAVSYLDESKKTLMSLPSEHSYNHPSKKNILSRIFYRSFDVDVYQKGQKDHYKGTLVFTYDLSETIYIGLVVWALIVVLFIPVILKFKKNLETEIEKDARGREIMATQKMISSVWHDIGQPLQVLKSIQEVAKGLTLKEKNQISASCEDITQIVGQLKGNTNEMENVQILPFIKELVETERVKYQSKDLEILFSPNPKSIEYFIKIQRSDFKRVFFNLVNNSVNAFNFKGSKITVELRSTEKEVVITIIDDGIGIKKEDLPYIGMSGKSLRENGNGIGLSSAMSKVDSWGGFIKIDSNYYEGTSVAITLPRVETPSWAKFDLAISDRYKKIVVIDDREQIFELIKDSVPSGLRDKLLYFQSFASLSRWLKNSEYNKDEVFFICDYDLGENSPTGISILRSIDCKKSSILLTNNYSDAHIQEECEELKVKMLPKTLLSEAIFTG